MKLRFVSGAFLFFFAGLLVASSQLPAPAASPIRVVIFKVDGLNDDLLEQTMAQIDPHSGRSVLPWFSFIFGANGTIFKNFYARGISLSAPSWSMLDTGHHTIIRGNVEYDRFTGYVYDYLNFFPFYIGYARHQDQDMPAVQVLNGAGIPLLIDAFKYDQVFQSFQLFQRGVRWTTLNHVLKQRFSSKVLLSAVESADTPSYDEILEQQTERELQQSLTSSQVLYLDFYTGDIDHEGHATNQSAALVDTLRRLDALAGRLWTHIQASPMAKQTVFVMVSDHGMNNVPGLFSQGFNLPDLFNSPAGGAHHVVTNRHQLSDYKLMGLDPLVRRVINPSTASFYLAGEANRYPTAWLDLDGNERASVQLRNSDLNKIHILLLELAKLNLNPALRSAVAHNLTATLDRHRAAWRRTVTGLSEEMGALAQAIVGRKKLVHDQKKRWNAQEKALGQDKAARRLADELQDWERQHNEYSEYLTHLRALIAFAPDPQGPFHKKVSDLIPDMSLGNSNTIGDIQNYVVGPSKDGLVLSADGKLDEARSFRVVNYFPLLIGQNVRNNPQPALTRQPIDFTAMRLPGDAVNAGGDESRQAYWLYAGDDKQLIITTDKFGFISVMPVRSLSQDSNGKVTWQPQNWRAGLPLRLFEDPQLHLPSSASPEIWLSQAHSERDWLQAIHKCTYSNGVIGITEEMSKVEDNVPGQPGINPVLLRFERRRRALVQADFHIFAADHWNFNVRNFNPGGNHGSFFRISTHSVWMMAGAGVKSQQIEEPYDSLNFASTILSLVGKAAPMPDRIVHIQ